MFKKIIAFFQKPYRWAILFGILLISATMYVLLDTFVIPKALTKTTTTTSITAATDSTSSSNDSSTALNANGATITSDSYKDDNLNLTIETVTKYDTTFYVADIQVSDAGLLKTAFADSTYGRNIKETTSNIAENNEAIFAINGDYYGFRDVGYVIRNGVLYRNTADEDTDALVIDSDGNFSIADESQTSAEKLLSSGAQQVLSFGPVLVENSKVAVNESTEVGQSMQSNPRTAIGQISALHYIVIVADGRTSASEGLSLYQLAQEFADRGATIAYNLDGGGSSTMWFNGEVVNIPTDGRSTGERSVSDILYFGY